MDKIEKRTAEELLAHTLNVKVETILLNPDATITNSEAIEFAKVFTAQELASYKEKLREEVELLREYRGLQNVYTDGKRFALQQVLQLIDKL